jgi:hypothetical protein
LPAATEQVKSATVNPRVTDKGGFYNKAGIILYSEKQYKPSSEVVVNRERLLFGDDD